MNIKKKIIERIVITGKSEDSYKAWNYVEKHNYTIKRSGPLITRDHLADTSRFKIIAERAYNEY